MEKETATPRGWGGHIGRSLPISDPKTKEQLIRFWAQEYRMQVPSKSGNLVWIDIYYASVGAAECQGGRPFDSLVSMADKAFFVLFVDAVGVEVLPSTRPILVVPNLNVECAWWVLPA